MRTYQVGLLFRRLVYLMWLLSCELQTEGQSTTSGGVARLRCCQDDDHTPCDADIPETERLSRDSHVTQRELYQLEARLKSKLETSVNDLLTNRDQPTESRNQSQHYGDCADVQLSGYRRSGIYTVYPQTNISSKLNVYCDMTESGGGWLVIQRRQNGVVNFTRTWSEYATGFGNLKTEFWLGNEHLHQLTRTRTSYRLLITLRNHTGHWVHAEYQNFFVDSQTDNYRISFTGYTGTAGDSLSGHNGHAFSTWDRDNDQSATNNCASYHNGGWWFSNCYRSNLNGEYGADTPSYKGIIWYDWTGYYSSLMYTEMKIKPM